MNSEKMKSESLKWRNLGEIRVKKGGLEGVL